MDDRGDVRFWSTQMEKEIRKPLRLLAHEESYFDEAAISADGVLIARENGIFSLWNLNTQKRLNPFETQSDGGPLAISPDGKTIAALDNKELVLIDATTGKRTSATRKYKGYLGYLKFSPNGNLLV